MLLCSYKIKINFWHTRFLLALFFFFYINDDDNGLLTGFPCSGSSLVGQTNAVATEIKMREIENKYL